MHDCHLTLQSCCAACDSLHACSRDLLFRQLISSLLAVTRHPSVHPRKQKSQEASYKNSVCDGVIVCRSGVNICVCLYMQARSKPVHPLKKPANAPFFLPTLAGLHSEPLFDPSAAPEADQDDSDKPSTSSRINKSQGDSRACLLSCFVHAACPPQMPLHVCM